MPFSAVFALVPVQFQTAMPGLLVFSRIHSFEFRIITDFIRARFRIVIEIEENVIAIHGFTHQQLKLYPRPLKKTSVVLSAVNIISLLSVDVSDRTYDDKDKPDRLLSGPSLSKQLKFCRWPSAKPLAEPLLGSHVNMSEILIPITNWMRRSEAACNSSPAFRPGSRTCR